MITKKYPRLGIVALLLAVIMAAAAFSACKLDNGDDPEPTEAPAPTEAGIPAATVILTSKHVEMTLYDFGQQYYNSQYLQYYMYGMMSSDDFFEAVKNELSSFAYLINAAVDDGIELTEEELEEVETTTEKQLEDLLEDYKSGLGDDVEDKDAEARAKLNEVLAEDGLDLDTFMSLAKENMRKFKLASKYYEKIKSSVEIKDADVLDYIEKAKTQIEEMTMSDFVYMMDEYNEGNTSFPVYIKEDCFSVNHIFVNFSSRTEEERDEKMKKIEERLPEAADFDAFMELETEFGEDPGMDSEAYRANGYVIHPDLESDYFPGFVYAAMNLHDGEWETTLETDPDTGEEFVPPELTFFELKDGTRVVKAATGSGMHYIIVNKEYKKGPVEYEKGDDNWNDWSEDAVVDKLDEIYDVLNEEWKTKYPLTINEELIKTKYLPDDDK